MILVCRPRCAAAPEAHSPASRSGPARHRHPHPPQSIRAARSASRVSSPSAWLTSSKLPSPWLRNTFTRGPALVSTIAARSIHPSLSMSTAVTPHPRVAPVSGSCTRSNRRPMSLRPRNVAPQRQPRRARMRHGNIHPAVFVVVENRDAHGWRQLLAFIQRCVGYFPSRGFTNSTGAGPSPVTAISTARSLLKSVRIALAVFPATAQPGRLGPLGKRLVPVIPPQHIRRIACPSTARPSETDPDPHRGRNPQT